MLILKQLTHNLFLLRFTHTSSMYEVRVVYMQQVKAYHRGVLSITQSRATKAKTKDENSESALLGAMGRTFIGTVLEKVNPGC